MHHPVLHLFAAAAVLAAPATAQFTHVIPNGFASVEANSGNYFPWSSTSTLWAGLRTTSLYDSTNFTNASINFPILVTRLRWRADSTSSAWTGGTFANATVQMATAAVDAMSPSNGSFAANFGPDLATVYAGSVTILPGSSSSPGPWAVDVALTTPRSGSGSVATSTLPPCNQLPGPFTTRGTTAVPIARRRREHAVVRQQLLPR